MQETNTKPLLIGTAIAVVAILGGLVWALMKIPATPPGQVAGDLTFSDENAPIFGKADSLIKVQIYSDLQCPACKAAEPSLKKAIATYGDRVAFVWNDFPLMTIHANARNAANAARCAQEQNRFSDFVDQVFARQTTWSSVSNPRDVFVSIAESITLEKERFTQCYDEKRYDNRVMSDVSEGTANGVRATPTFIIDGQVYNGITYADWEKALNAALAP